MQRREFLATLVAVPLASTALKGAQEAWGAPVLDVHYHTSVNTMAHMEGAGVSHAVLLPGGGGNGEMQKALVREHPKQFVRNAALRVDPRDPESLRALRAELQAGAVGIGEMSSPLEIDSPEMRRVYEISAEFKAPVTMHIQGSSIPGRAASFPGFERTYEKMVKAYPKAIFVGHAQTFWAHISATPDKDIEGSGSLYPIGKKVTRGGLSDRLLSDYENVYGSLDAKSGRTALSREPDFTIGFLERHKDKLMFGSDCPCTDGHGANNKDNPNQCTARDNLTLILKYAKTADFRKIVYGNAANLYRFPA